MPTLISANLNMVYVEPYPMEPDDMQYINSTFVFSWLLFMGQFFWSPVTVKVPYAQM